MININDGQYINDFSILFGNDEDAHFTHACILKRSIDTTVEEDNECVVICTRDESEMIKIASAEDAASLIEALSMAIEEQYWDDEEGDL